LADQLAAGPTKALKAIREMCWDSLERGFEEQLRVEALVETDIGHTADHREGVAAFLGKRPPRFTGQ
jgi:2-(1,2-epoxy-1,2-dihydrophenyl)acetyl-CoA isomerase